MKYIQTQLSDSITYAKPKPSLARRVVAVVAFVLISLAIGSVLLAMRNTAQVEREANQYCHGQLSVACK